MKKRKNLVAAVVAALAVTGVVAVGAPAAADMQVERPFRYVSDGTIVNEPILECSLVTGPTFLCDQTFEGIDESALHMGTTTSAATGELQVFVGLGPCALSPTGDPSFYYQSDTDRVIVAANGDELHVSTTVTGCGGADLVTEPTGSFTVTGGTGRFDGATGSGEVSSVVDGSSISMVWTGTVTY